MKILITGNMGYVGPVLVRHLRRQFPQARIIGVDSGFFAQCLTNAVTLPEALLDEQHFCEVRDFTLERASKKEVRAGRRLSG